MDLKGLLDGLAGLSLEKLGMIAIVLLAGGIALGQIKKHRTALLGLVGLGLNGRIRLSPELEDKIDERVVHKWSSVIAPTFLITTDELARLRKEVDTLDDAREQQAKDINGLHIMVGHVASVQGEMMRKVDRLLERG